MANHYYKSGEWGGWGEANVYDEPQNCGLKIVAQAQAEMGYEFDMIVCFADIKTGSLWLAHDSGCSCPTPFEDTHSFFDFTPLRMEHTIDRFVDQYTKNDKYAPYKPVEVAEFRRKCRAALRARKKALA